MYLGHKFVRPRTSRDMNGVLHKIANSNISTWGGVPLGCVRSPFGTVDFGLLEKSQNKARFWVWCFLLKSMKNIKVDPAIIFDTCTFIKLEYNYRGFYVAQSGKCLFEGSVHFCRGSCLDVPATQDRDAQQLLTLPVLSNFSPRIGFSQFCLRT